MVYNWQDELYVRVGEFMKLVKKIWSIVSKVIIVLLILMMIVMLVMKISGNNVNLLGFNVYYIATPSMEPTLEVGDLILSKNVKDYSKLEIHDVVTYKGEVGSYKGKLITHEIIDIKFENDEYTFITKGTKENAVVDPEVSQDQIVAVMLFEIPLLGKLVTLLNNRIVFFVAIIIPLAIMLVLEVANVAKILKQDSDKEENEEHEEQN